MLEKSPKQSASDDANEMIRLTAGSSEDRIRVLLLNDEINEIKMEAEDVSAVPASTPELRQEMDEMIALASGGTEDGLRALLLNDEVTEMQSHSPSALSSKIRNIKSEKDTETYILERKLNDDMNEMIALTADGSEDKMRVLLLNDEVQKEH